VRARLSDGQTAAATAADRCNKVGHIQGGSKSKLLILSEYVKKQEDRRNVNKYEQLQIK